MSVTVDIGVAPPLNDQQVDAIIREALTRGYFETGPEGQLPEGDALKDAATELIRQARLSYAAGNRTEGVLELLFIAECDLNPPISDKGGQVAAVEDLSKQSSEFLQKLEQTLQNYDPSPEVDENLKMIREELARRGGNGSSPTESVAEANGQPEATPAQTPETASRKELEDRLTFPTMRHHGVDPSQIASLSDDELRWIVEHPPGSEDAVLVQQAASPSAPSSDVVETTRMVTEQPEQQLPAAAPPVESSVVAETPTGISSERLALEEQVTGPMLKVFGRGRADVPSIGDNELRFMVENSDGRVTKEALLAARALDEAASPEEAEEAQQQVVAATEGQPPTIAEQGRVEKQDPADTAFAPAGSDSEPDTKPDNSGVEIAQSPVPSGDSTPSAVDTGRVTRKAALMRDLPANPAQETIDRERFPVPPEISEDPPRLPFDMSKCSDDAIRSLHARLHACHSRANYVVGLWDGELRDVVKLRKGREVNVANEVPAKDGRSRVTDAQREAIVAADPEVVSLREQEHDIERVLRQLITLRDGYGRDVSTCSRQWAMRKEESSGAGGLK